MPWKQDKDERRRAFEERRRIARKIKSSRVDLETFARTIRRLADAELDIWKLVETIRPPLRKSERIIVQEAVAPHLVRMRPSNARRGDENQDYRLRS